MFSRITSKRFDELALQATSIFPSERNLKGILYTSRIKSVKQVVNSRGPLYDKYVEIRQKLIKRKLITLKNNIGPTQKRAVSIGK